MGLLSRYAAPFMELSSRMYPRPAPQLPLWIRLNPRGGLLVSHGDCRRQDYSGVPLFSRFLASAANSISSVSARPQYSPVVPARAGCHRKDMLQKQNSAGAQQGQRLYFSNVSRFIRKPESPKHVRPTFCSALTKLKKAVPAKDTEKMLEALENLKEFAEKTGYYDHEYKAKKLLSAVVSPLCKHQLHKHGGGLDDGVAKASLEVARLLLQNAPEEIRIKLYKEVELMKPILERIIRDYGGSAADHEVIELANEILAKLPSTTK